MNALERYIPEPMSGCWLWTGALSRGYGRINRVMAHRIFFEHYHGPVPSGLEINHKCRVKCCVNPDHLEAVTHSENILHARRTGFSKPRPNTHCRNGHEYTEENTKIYKGFKQCMACRYKHWKRLSRQRSLERKFGAITLAHAQESDHE